MYGLLNNMYSDMLVYYAAELIQFPYLGISSI